MIASRTLAAAAVLASFVLVTPRARAANILFVADGDADIGIATALMMDGHTVTARTMDLDEAGTNASLIGDLSEYDAIFWSGAGGIGYVHSNAAQFTNLTDYVSGGGRVMYVGYDSTLGESMLLTFLGATSSSDAVGSAPGPIGSVDTSLTTGVLDVRGLVPSSGSYDKDCLRGFATGVMVITTGASDPTCGQWTLRRLGDGEIAWVSNGDYSGSHASWEVRATDATGAYNAAIRNFAAAADTASHVPGAPLITFDPVYTAEEGAAVTLTVSVVDEEGDPVTFSWDTDDDGTFGELTGMTTYTIPAGTTDGDDSLRITVTASDGTHTAERRRTIRISNVAPRIVSDPPTMTSVGAMVRYTLEVEDPAGAGDPPHFSIVRGPDGAAITEEGVWVFNPTELDVTLPSETIDVAVQVDDGDGGMDEQTWEIMVSPNRVPDGLTLIYPASGLALATPMPRLVVGNGVDPDPMDTLTYFFEVDDEPEFAEPHLFASGRLAQGVGYTAFQLPEALPNGIYYWRAWMSDGAAETTPLSTSFFVVPDPRIDGGAVAEVDAGVMTRDGGTTEPDARGGCACAAPGRGAGGGAIAFLIAAVALVRTRRRR